MLYNPLCDHIRKFGIAPFFCYRLTLSMSYITEVSVVFSVSVVTSADE